MFPNFYPSAGRNSNLRAGWPLVKRRERSGQIHQAEQVNLKTPLTRNGPELCATQVGSTRAIEGAEQHQSRTAEVHDLKRS